MLSRRQDDDHRGGDPDQGPGGGAPARDEEAGQPGEHDEAEQRAWQVDKVLVPDEHGGVRLLQACPRAVGHVGGEPVGGPEIVPDRGEHVAEVGRADYDRKWLGTREMHLV